MSWTKAFLAGVTTTRTSAALPTSFVSFSNKVNTNIMHLLSFTLHLHSLLGDPLNFFWPMSNDDSVLDDQLSQVGVQPNPLNFRRRLVITQNIWLSVASYKLFLQLDLVANSSRITTATRMIVEQSFAVLHQFKFRCEDFKCCLGFQDLIQNIQWKYPRNTLATDTEVWKLGES